jgi:hypothetical protein
LPYSIRKSVAAVVALVVVGAAGFWLRARRNAPGAPPTSAGSATSSETVEDGDRLVRELVGGITNDPLASLWLSGSGFVRAIESAVASVSVGETPAKSLRLLAPRQPFRVVQEGGRTVIDARSYHRYDAAADAFAALDPAGCARAFRRLEPLLEAAYREDRHPKGGFRFALARAISSLLDTPVAPGELSVLPRVHLGVGSASLPESAVLVYEFTDPKLEALAPAQKQLLRMGARNARLVQSKLEELARAIDLSLQRAKADRPAA